MGAKVPTGPKAMNCANPGTKDHFIGPELHWLLSQCLSPFWIPMFPALGGEQSVQAEDRVSCLQSFWLRQMKDTV